MSSFIKEYKRVFFGLLLITLLMAGFRGGIVQAQEGPHGNTSTVLVMDLSGSMNDPDMSGVSKLDAAKAAANQLLQAIAQESGNLAVHQVGLVSFREVATIESPLTTDMASLQAIVNQMWADNGTNISDGVEKALDMLATAPAENRKYIILLSDGLPNNGLETIDQFLAGPVARARSMNVCINTIGLGEGGEMNADLLRAIAEGSGCGKYYPASESFQLRAVYVQLRHITTGERVETWEGNIHQGEEVQVGDYQVLQYQEALDVSLVWPGSKLVIQLKDPKNAVVDQNYPGAQIFDTPASQRILVKKPIPGNWGLNVIGVQVPEQVIPYSLVASSRMMQVTPTWTPTPTIAATPTPIPVATPTPVPTPMSPPEKGGSGMGWFLLLLAVAVLIIVIVLFSARRKRQSGAYLEIAAGPFTGQRFYITKTPFFIGRSSTNDLVLNDPQLSRRHAVIQLGGGVYTIEDLRSQLGVLVNGQRVLRAPLTDGTHIQLAQTVFTFHQS